MSDRGVYVNMLDKMHDYLVGFYDAHDLNSRLLRRIETDLTNLEDRVKLLEQNWE